MNDFIAKKREIFLVQMSLDTKRAEITKLEERALQVPHAFHCFMRLTHLPTTVCDAAITTWYTQLLHCGPRKLSKIRGNHI